MRRLFISGFATLFVAVSAFGLMTVRSGAGLAAATAARDQFRADIGGGTVAGPNGSFGGVRREINWDDVPDAFAAPNNLSANFFNVNSPRGVVFSTPGTGFQVSATAASGTPVRFGNINPTYAAEFVAFSPERLFAPLGGDFPMTDINFFLPETNTPATVNSFGAMFSDNDGGPVTYVSTVIDLFGPGEQYLGRLSPPPADKSVSFVGVTFTSGERIAHVRIQSGNYSLGANYIDGEFPVSNIGETPAIDVVAMDDFIYSEPVILTSVPVMSAPILALLAAALIGIGVLAKAR